MAKPKDIESLHEPVPTKEEDNSTNDSPPTDSSASLLRVIMVAKAEIPMMVVTFLLLAVSEAANLIVPLILADGYDVLIENYAGTLNQPVMNAVNNIMVKVITIFIAGAIILPFFQTAIQGVIGERLVARLRCQLYGAILRQEIAFFDEYKTGDLISRLGTDTTLLQSAISLSVPEAISGFIKTIIALTLMFVISAKLAAVALGGVALVFVFSVPLGKTLASLSKDYQSELGEAQTHSTEAISAIRTVQSFAAESKETKRFDR